MFKNLSGDGLGVSARQNEKVELALTYGFKGIDIDLAEMVSRVGPLGEDFAKRYISSAQKSAKLQIGSFKLPISISGEDADFNNRLAKLETAAAFAKSIDATRCTFDISPGSNRLAYHENFEMYRNRLGAIADILGKHGIRLGLGLVAAEDARKNYEYQFVYEVEPLMTLVKTIGRPNVGVALDLWNWTVGSGALDQIEELNVEDIVAVRVADVPENADPKALSFKQRLLPGTTPSSRAVKLLQILKAKGYQGPISAAPHASQFSGLTRDAVVVRTSEALDRVLDQAGVPRAVPAEA
ncbi:MAG: TIM barrel protein [Pirellulaceae bacterium]